MWASTGYLVLFEIVNTSTVYNMTLVYSSIGRTKTSLIFFFRGLVYLAAHWAIGIFFNLFIVCSGWCSRQSIWFWSVPGAQWKREENKCYSAYTYWQSVKVTVYSNTKIGIKMPGDISTTTEESTALCEAVWNISPEVALISMHQLDALQFVRESLLSNLEKAPLTCS